MNIAKHPPCTPKCPSRGMGCHAGCEKYAEWKRQMEEITRERRRQAEAAQGVQELARERKDWLRSRGYKTNGGMR